MFLSGHDKIVGLILVVYNVFQGNSELFVEVVKEVLFVNKGHSANLLHDSLRCRSIVFEVGRDGYSQLAPEFLPLEA